VTRIGRKEALSLYREKTGHGITHQGLFHLAKRNGFVEQAEDEFHYSYLKEKMESYLDLTLKDLPVGYMTIEQLAKKYSTSYNRVYVIMLHEECVEYGRRRLKAYNESRYLELIKKKGANENVK
jgi:hypothetical protein